MTDEEFSDLLSFAKEHDLMTTPVDVVIKKWQKNKNKECLI